MQPAVLFESLEVDSLLGAATIGPITTQDLVKWAGASGDFNPIHYDQDIAQAQGLPRVVIPGTLRLALAASVLTNAVGAQGRLKKIKCSYRGLDLPGDALTCEIRVVRKYVAPNGDKCVECDVVVMNSRQEKNTGGSATIVFFD